MNAKQRRKAYRHAKRLKTSHSLCMITRGWQKGKIGRITWIAKYGQARCNFTTERNGKVIEADSLNIRPLTPREIAKFGLDA